MKMLIVAPAWVGDMVMSHSLVRLLQDRISPIEIHMLAPPATAPLATRMAGVDQVHVLEAGHGDLGLGLRWRLARQLRSQGFSHAIVLPNSFKSALVPFWAGIRRRTGWTGESRWGVLNDRRTLNPEQLPLMIERFMALGIDAVDTLSRPYPLPELQTDRTQGERLVTELGLTGGAATVLCPGAEFGPAKRWPAQHFAALARHESEAGREVWLVGSPGEREVCAEIESLAGTGVINLAGRTSLLEAIDLLDRADRVVCNDSGLMHVASAVGTPLVALFGSTSPDFTPPLGEHASVVRNPLPCSPCFERVCPLGHLRCLTDLEPEQVIEVLN